MKKRTYEAVASRDSGRWTMQIRGVDDLLVNAVMLDYAEADLRAALAGRLGVAPDLIHLDVSVEDGPTGSGE